MLDASLLLPEHPRPLKRTEYDRLVALGAFEDERVELLHGVLAILAHDESEPEPDVAVVPLGDYREEHPASALLVIEVALTSLNKDRKVKAPLYAASGFREYWIVNVTETVIEVHRAPAAGRYASVTHHAPGEVLRPEAFPGVAVSVAEVFS